MKPRILIADDEADILEMVAGFFRSRGYEVLTARDGGEALRQAGRQPQLILLDVGMPGPDGLEVCRRIREHLACPILFLTARVTDADKVNGFASGGDDYIVKPFSLIELEARVAAHLRREARRQASAQVCFSGELSIDYSARVLLVNGARITLPKKEFAIVELLSQNAGQVFDRERIYERVWGYDSDGDSKVVAEHIRRIRAALAQHTDKSWLETVWGVGYKWVK